MSSKRDELFKANHYRYKKLQKHFKFSFWAGLIPSGAAFVFLLLYYAFSAILNIIGSAANLADRMLKAMITGEVIEKQANPMSVPYLFMAYLFAAAAITAAAHFFKARKPHYVLFGLYAVGAVSSLIGMFTGSFTALFGLYALAYGCYGMWLEDFTRRLYKELDYLSLQEGYPDFIEAINEPKAMANSLGLRYYQSEYQKRLRKEEKEDGNTPENSEAPQSFEMDELSIDSPPPKGTRKIDNML